MKCIKRRKTPTLRLAVALPGSITANVDQDAGGIFTYSFVRTHSGSFLSRNLMERHNHWLCTVPGLVSQVLLGTCSR